MKEISHFLTDSRRLKLQNPEVILSLSLGQLAMSVPELGQGKTLEHFSVD